MEYWHRLVDEFLPVFDVSVCALDDHRAPLTGTMRTAFTDERARGFRRCWTPGVGARA